VVVKRAFIGSQVLTPETEYRNYAVLVSEGYIEGLVPADKVPCNYEVIDFSDYIIVPGLIDIHIHGYGGHDTTLGTVEDLVEIGRGVSRHGVTAILLANVAAPRDKLLEIARNVKDAVRRSREKVVGAEILGLYLEGPFVNPEKKGAHNPKHLRKPDIGELEELYRVSEGTLRVVAIAPELPNALEFIERAKQLGLVVSAAHTNATYEEAMRAFNAGVTLCTHLFNAMRGFHHREPGIVGAALERDDVYVELIVDLIHLHPTTIRLVTKCKPVDKVILITDAIAATGLPDGEYVLGDLPIVVKGGISRLKDTGALAGSTLTLDRAIKNMVEVTKLPLREVLKMVTVNPATVLGEKRRGRVDVGYIANLTVLDKELNVVATVVRGEVVYQR